MRNKEEKEFKIGRERQNFLISFFAIPIDFACLILDPVLFQSLVASPMKVCYDLGSLKFSEVTLLVTLVSWGCFTASNFPSCKMKFKKGDEDFSMIPEAAEAFCIGHFYDLPAQSQDAKVSEAPIVE